jgi:hypothetical protein
MFLKKEGRRPDDNYVPQDPYDEFSEQNEDPDSSLVENPF